MPIETRTTLRTVMHREQFTRTTPLCKKCLTFQKDVLDFQNKFNVAVRLTSYLTDDLKAEMKARFDLTDSRFYTLATQDLERYLSEDHRTLPAARRI